MDPGSYSPLTLIYFISIFPNLHWKIQTQLGAFGTTEELINPVKVFCLPHTQMKSEIRLSVGIIKIGTGKKAWAHGKAFQIPAAFKSYQTLFLNASVLLHESSLHPKQGQSCRKQAFCRYFPPVPLVLLHVSLLLDIFSFSPHGFFFVLFLYYPLLFCFLVQCYSCSCAASGSGPYIYIFLLSCSTKSGKF